VAADAQGRKSPGFVVTNRNKRSITLDVRAPGGREAFLALARVSDVIVENFRPGTLERWDLAPATLLAVNPGLVLLRSSGFGQTGPYTGRAAFNPVGLAFGGITYLNGWPDRPPRCPIRPFSASGTSACDSSSARRARSAAGARRWRETSSANGFSACRASTPPTGTCRSARSRGVVRVVISCAGTGPRSTPSPRASGGASAQAGTAPTWTRPSRPRRSSPFSTAWRHHGCSILRFR